MRVVGGTVGGRRLAVPSGARATTRPSTELVRGAIFNTLTSIGVLQEAVVWDLFAGSGALGIEALSRGAAAAVFVERDRQAVATIRSNLAALGLDDRATVVCRDALRWVERAGRADVILVDPPYTFAGWAPLLASMRSGLVVCESDRTIAAVEGWEITRVRRHGGTVVTLMQPRGAAAP
jgi:16S rRNA (guanine966-N2)-methyltransferase